MLDRSGAKAAVSDKDASDDDLELRLDVAAELRTKLAEYQHLQVSRNQELGWLGRFLGGEKNSPIAVAAIVLVVSVMSFLIMHSYVAFGELTDDRMKVIVSAADKCLALATLALGYVCGKSS